MTEEKFLSDVEDEESLQGGEIDPSHAVLLRALSKFEAAEHKKKSERGCSEEKQCDEATALEADEVFEQFSNSLTKMMNDLNLLESFPSLE
eukprot:snap_masked-scaffold_6-processed-gene-10.18-mRNA-1 protein AED:1.00 eAED:1.00 QI:0/-1/0/0/-1/1/1/0/90